MENIRGIAGTSALQFDNAAATGSPTISVRCFDNEIPPFIEKAIDHLYGSLFSSFNRFRVYGGIENASTYIAYRNKEIAAIFLFRREANHVRVLNQGMAVSEADAGQFADYVFKRFKMVDMVSFEAVESSIRRFHYPYQQFNCTEDSVVTLPKTADEYLNNFGKSMRKNIKYYLNRLKREFPSFSYRIYDRHEFDEQHVRAIIRFNRMRFANKNKVSAIDCGEEERIVQMVRECGIVGVATIDGLPVAGSITYRIGDHYYSWLKAHDPAYDDYRFGILLSYLMICECIRRGGKAFHFMWGRQPQKALLQGQHRDRANLTIWRSNLHAMRHLPLMFRQAMKNRARNAKLRLIAMEKKEGRLPQLVQLATACLRRTRQALWNA